MKTFHVVARKKAPPGYVGVWVNIYKRGNNFYAGGTYRTRAKADTVANPRRYDCIYVYIYVDIKRLTV